MMPDRIRRHGKGFNPNWKPPPDVMSCDEIRWWLKALTTRYHWQKKPLARLLGTERTRFYDKITGKRWLFPSEQIRYSHILKRIISGELVLIPGRRGGCPPKWPGKVVIADFPVPLAQPPRFRFDLRTGKVERPSPHETPGPALPSFKTLLDNPEKWSCLLRGGPA